jgi:hypothetical protein
MCEHYWELIKPLSKAPDTLEDPPIIQDPSWTNDAKDSLEDPPLKISFFFMISKTFLIFRYLCTC